MNVIFEMQDSRKFQDWYFRFRFPRCQNPKPYPGHYQSYNWFVLAPFDERPLAHSCSGVKNPFFENNFAGFPVEIHTFFLFRFTVFSNVGVVALCDILHKTLFQLVFFSFVNILFAFNTNGSVRSW